MPLSTLPGSKIATFRVGGDEIPTHAKFAKVLDGFSKISRHTNRNKITVRRAPVNIPHAALLFEVLPVALQRLGSTRLTVIFRVLPWREILENLPRLLRLPS